MAKKSRRARKKTSRKVSRGVVSARATQAAVSSVQGSAVEPAADRQEYAYVVADIRQVAILAAALFVLLVGLSFFIG
jgi:hypothetical protein